MSVEIEIGHHQSKSDRGTYNSRASNVTLRIASALTLYQKQGENAVYERKGVHGHVSREEEAVIPDRTYRG